MPDPSPRKAEFARLAGHLRRAADVRRSLAKRKQSARDAAWAAWKLGLIDRPVKCEWCRRRVPLERHHWDYRWPLSVWWFCRDCHSLADNINRLEDAG